MKSYLIRSSLLRSVLAASNLLMCFSLVGCVALPKPVPITYTKSTQETFQPTGSVAVLWGRDASTMSRKYREIGTVFAAWSGPSHSTPMWLGETGSRTLQFAPSSPLPVSYRLKAAEIGAHALLIPSVNQNTQSIKTVMPTYPNKYNLTNEMYMIITTYSAKLTAIRFEDQE